jgi:methionine-rich copper-binding protein CopC
MFKHLFILLIWLSLGQTSMVFAHAVVTEHSLKIKPIHANTEEKVELDFNSQIEIGLSQIFLVRKGDKQELLNIANGKGQGQIIINIPKLEAGNYALRLKVFAADGHLTEDLIHFSITP